MGNMTTRAGGKVFRGQDVQMNSLIWRGKRREEEKIFLQKGNIYQISFSYKLRQTGEKIQRDIKKERWARREKVSEISPSHSSSPQGPWQYSLETIRRYKIISLLLAERQIAAVKGKNVRSGDCCIANFGLYFRHFPYVQVQHHECRRCPKSSVH